MCLAKQGGVFYIDVNSNRIFFFDNTAQQWRVGVIREKVGRRYIVILEAGESYAVTYMKTSRGKFLETDVWEMYMEEYNI